MAEVGREIEEDGGSREEVGREMEEDGGSRKEVGREMEQGCLESFFIFDHFSNSQSSIKTHTFQN